MSCSLHFWERKLLARPAAMPQYVFPMNLYATRTYERAIRKLLSEDARRDMEAAIVTCARCRAGHPGDRRHPQVALGRLRPGQARRHPCDLLLARRGRRRYTC